LQLYLVTGLVILIVSLALLGLGIPYSLTHHSCLPSQYCITVNPLTGANSSLDAYDNPILEQAAFYGVILGIIAAALLMVHVAEKRDAKNNIAQ
jgi:hypothetical protein